MVVPVAQANRIKVFCFFFSKKNCLLPYGAHENTMPHPELLQLSSPPTMGHTQNRMQRDGLIRCEPHSDDNRAQLIRVTPQAAALESRAKAA